MITKNKGTQMQKKKIYQSKDIKILKIAEIVIWIIPLICFIKNVFVGFMTNSAQFKDNFIGTIGMYALFSIGEALGPFLLAKFMLRSARKQMVKNSTIITMDNFDYYRDKLVGLTLGEISLLADLKLEPRKDITAYILKYMDMGILTEFDGNYHVKSINESLLKESDRYILGKLEKGQKDFELDSEWKRLIEQEALEDGYITKKQEEKNKGCGCGCASCCSTFFIAAILLIIKVVLDLFLYKENGSEGIFQTTVEDLTLAEQLASIFVSNELWEMVTGVIMYGVAFVFFIFPIIFVASYFGKTANIKWYKRTELGTEMAECIHGMKNFIHDFSNLSEANQEHLILWDDYLVYAVLLEENEKIIKEIMKRRKINPESFGIK